MHSFLLTKSKTSFVLGNNAVWVSVPIFSQVRVVSGPSCSYALMKGTYIILGPYNPLLRVNIQTQIAENKAKSQLTLVTATPVNHHNR